MPTSPPSAVKVSKAGWRPSWRWAPDWLPTARYPGACNGSNRRTCGRRLGLHPERLEASWEEVEAVLDQLRAHRDRVVALGEVGLPHYALLDGAMTAEQVHGGTKPCCTPW